MKNWQASLLFFFVILLIRWCSASAPTSRLPEGRGYFETYTALDLTSRAISAELNGGTPLRRSWSLATPTPFRFSTTVPTRRPTLRTTQRRTPTLGMQDILNAMTGMPTLSADQNSFILTAKATLLKTLTQRPNMRTATPSIQQNIVIPTTRPTQRRTPVPTITPRPVTTVMPRPTVVPRTQAQPEANSSPPSVLINIEDRINIDGITSAAAQVVLGWLGGMLVLTVGGALFNRVLLYDMERGASRSRPHPLSSPGQVIQPVYAVITLAATVFIYLLVPLLVMVVILLWLNANRNILLTPIDLIVFIISTLGILSMLVSLRKLGQLLYSTDRSSGYMLYRHEAPKLWEFVQAITPVDEIRLRSDAHLTLMEGKRRILVLGVALLGEFSQQELKALLMQESTRSGFKSGQWASHTRGRLRQYIGYLVEKGNNRWYDLIWVIVAFFSEIYQEITDAAVWLNILLVDRKVAAAMNDSQMGMDSIYRAVTTRMRFEIHEQTHIKNALQQRRPIFNLYQEIPLSSAQTSQIERNARIMMVDLPHRHVPSLRLRRDILKCWMPPTEATNHSLPAWELFENAEAAQHKMTVIRMQEIPADVFATEFPKPPVHYRSR